MILPNFYTNIFVLVNRLLLFIVLLLGNQAFAQPTDVLLLKKNNKTIKRFYSGSNIEITTNKGVYLTAAINTIKNDTLFLKQYVVRQVPTQLGVFILDTVTTYYYKYHYNEIKAIGKTGRRFNLSASSASLLGGGILLTLAGGVVYLVDRDNFSPSLMIASASLAAVGYVMGKTTGKGMIIGKKYSLGYLELSGGK